MPGADGRLDSWKEIAAHFRRDVTTVRRWERREGLPVHRHPHESRSSVYAYVTELDDWWARRSAAAPPAAHPSSGAPASAAVKVAAGAAIVLIGALAASPGSRFARANITTVAVLPFVVSTESAEAHYLSEGLTDALIDGVSPATGLKVIARSSVARYRDRSADLDSIGRELGADALVVGTTAISPRQLIITADLLHPSSGRRLWQSRYSAEPRDLLAVEAVLVRDLAHALGRDVAETAPRHPSTLEAYWTYLEGRRDWNRRTPEGLRDAARLFTRATQLDPGFALAYAGTADAESLLGYYRVSSLEESLARAEAAATRALSIDERLAEAHAALGQIYASRWQWSEADRSYRRALELNPNYATARHWYSNHLSIVGRDDDAIAEARVAVALDPLSPIVRSGALGHALARAGRYDDALAEYARVLEMDPAFANARVARAAIFADQRMRDDAMREIAIIGTMRPVWMAGFAAMHAEFGDLDQARRILRAIEHDERASHVSIAHVYAALGDRAAAIDRLQQAFAQRDPDLAPAVRERWFAPLRADPRVIPLLRGLKLPLP